MPFECSFLSFMISYFNLSLWEVQNISTLTRNELHFYMYFFPPGEEGEDGAGQRGHGRINLQRMREMGVSGSGTHDEAVQEMDASGSGIHDELEVLPVTVPDGENSSPSVPEGTGGPKSK